MCKYHPFVLLFYRLALPNSKVGKEARLVAEYNEASQANRDAALIKLATFLCATHSFSQLAKGHWQSRTGMVEVFSDVVGHEITIFGGSVLDTAGLTPKQSLNFTSIIIASLPGDRRATPCSRPF